MKNQKQGVFLSPYAKKYVSMFNKQIKRILATDEGYKFPLYERKYFYLFKVFYESKASDADIEIIKDLLQSNKVIVNDNIIRDYAVLTGIDKEIPRTHILIFDEVKNAARL